MALTKKDIKLIKSMFDEQSNQIKAIDHKIDAVDKRLEAKIESTRTDLSASIKSLEISMRTEFKGVYARFDRTDRAIQSLVAQLNATLTNHHVRITRLEEQTGI